MNRKKITPNHLLVGRGFSRIIPTFVFAIFYLCGTILAAPTIYAAGVPGGNVTDPVVRAVDIAKPAMVRILTTIGGRLNVRFTALNSSTFPPNGGTYKLQLLGSGAFISAHGDILTADHVVNPPHDAATDQALYEMAAQDVANYINANHLSNVQWTALDAFTELSNGALNSQSQYDPASSKIYRSTDFTGSLTSTSLADMPSDTYANVDTIRKESSFQDRDTAIIHVNMDDTPSIKLGDSSNVAPQDQLTIIGYPGNGDILRDNARTLNEAVNLSTGFFTASVNKVYVSALKQSSSGAPLIQIGGNVEHGDSGGPALDSDGNIVGIVSFGGTDAPDGTSFLQASSSAQQFIDALQLDTSPGAFQTAWNGAFTQYSSTQPGHWRLAQQQLQKLQGNYPNFHAVQPFLNYAAKQASKEATTSINIPLLIAVLLILVVIFVLVLMLFLARRKKNLQAASTTQPPSYQPSYNGAGAWPEQLSSSGSMSSIDLKDEADQEAGTPPDTELAQPRAMQPLPMVPQTPTPVASYSAAQSGQLPVVPNQPAMSPWPQPVGYGSTPRYGQAAPYGQPAYNPGQQSRPAQGMPNPAYPAQSPYSPQPQQYAPYAQPPATPWPPVSGNTPMPPARASYVPQNPAQQGAAMQYGQQTPSYGTPYSQPPQGYGAMPTPTQPRPTSMQSEQVPTYIVPDAATTSDEPTVRANPKIRPAPEEIPEAGEEKKNTASSMSDLSKDQTEIKTVRSGEDTPTQLGEI